MSRGLGSTQREVLSALERRQNESNRAAWFTLRQLGLVAAGSSAARLNSVRRAVDGLAKLGHIERAVARVPAVARDGQPLRRNKWSYIEMRRVTCIRLDCSDDPQRHEADLKEWVFFKEHHAEHLELRDPGSPAALECRAELQDFAGITPIRPAIIKEGRR